MIDNYSAPEEKVRLFSSLFRGRTDIYARRYESAATGRIGYSPVCLHRWKATLCDMRRTRCAVCPHRRFAPLTDEVFLRHLLGEENGRPFAAAVYPLGADERTRFAVISLSETTWRADALSVAAACGYLRIPCVIERAMEGARAWFFFAEAVEGRLARDVATAVLFEAYRRRPEIGMAIFNAILPAQDTVPRGQLGATISLPLHPSARKIGRTVFVNPAADFAPYADQWAFLGQVRRMVSSEAEKLVSEALSTRTTLAPPDPSTHDDFSFLTDSTASVQPESNGKTGAVTVRLDNHVGIERRNLSPAHVAALMGLASFTNPEFYNAQRMRLPARAFRRVISCASLDEKEVTLPRGCREAALRLLGAWGFTCEIADERLAGEPLDVDFHGELRPEQKRAATAVLAHEDGVLAAGTAFGKTVLAAFVIAARKTSTLVIVNRRQLQMQWVARLATFLDIPEKDIGRIGGGVSRPNGRLDVALAQSLSRGKRAGRLPDDYGQVIVDECHALPAPTFEAVVDRYRARHFLGLSATVARRDGHHPQIVLQCGPVRHRADGRRATALDPFEHVVLVHPTAFAPSAAVVEPDGRPRLPALLSEIMADEARNRAIVADVLAEVAAGRSPVVLSERRAHLVIFEEMLGDKVDNIVVMRGGMGKRELKKVRERLDAIPDGAPRVLLATGPYLGEGFDDARLDTLFLALPVSWRGRITQYVGRLHRRHAGKKEVRVHDYVDLDIPVCNRMFDRRSAGYEALGYKIVLPLSATPGWPKEVLVPLERDWQETYAASVKRLCIDGVDAALASLFVVATRTIADNAEGVDRARSAAEAFLFRRLETLSETRGCFVLNAKLPIAFGASPFLEPDLVSADLRLVVEIDGAQHLGSADAYRRDRRKDVLLQENGYLVMRFLYDDVLADLPGVLHAILWEVLRRKGDRQEEGRKAPPLVSRPQSPDLFACSDSAMLRPRRSTRISALRASSSPDETNPAQLCRNLSDETLAHGDVGGGSPEAVDVAVGHGVQRAGLG